MAKNFGFTIDTIEIWNNASDSSQYLNITEIESKDNLSFDDGKEFKIIPIAKKSFFQMYCDIIQF